MRDYKRLTIKNSDGTYSQPTGLTFEKTFYKLAELEDKIEQGELVENTVVTYVNMARSGNKTLIDKALKYDELKSKIENQTLIELPCNIGHKVYVIEENEVKSAEIWRIILTPKYKEFKWFIPYNETEALDVGSFRIEEIGKTVFLTRAEAEARLKELKGEKL